MMWTNALLLLLAGVAFASQGGYENGKEYNYKVRSRTVASIDSQSNQYAGVLIEARLTLQPNGQDTLRAKITRARYTPIHTNLDRWDAEISPNQENMQDFPISSHPFEIKTKNGVVKDLVVDKSISTWEMNFLKSVVSQLQANTQGDDALDSNHNQFPEGSKPSASFKTMEDTVGGKCEVRYDISPLTEQELQNNPELAPMPELREDGDIISAVKTKNYSNCEQRVSYNFGVDGRNDWKPSGNDNGNQLSRSTVSRVIVTGNLKSNVIQSSVTINKVVHATHSNDPRKLAMVASKVNVTLHEMKDAAEPIPAPSRPESAQNLVYSYNDAAENESGRRQNKMSHERRNRRKNLNGNSNESEENNSGSNESRYESSASLEDNDDNMYLQPMPKMTDAPQIPMSPLFVGNNGKSIRKSDKIDVLKAAKAFAQKIANDMQNPDSMLEEQTLEKFAKLSQLVRTMNAEQIAEVQKDLYEPRQSRNQLNPNNQGRRKAWVAFRDAVALSGTGPALLNIKQWIQNKQIKGSEAASIVDNIARSARIPSSAFTDMFFELVQMPEVKEDTELRNNAILSFADMMRHVAVDKRSSHNRYPVHAFGKFSKKGNKNLEEKYLPYMGEKLKAAIDSGDSAKVLRYTTALGKTGHQRILSYFEPYLEGKKQVSQFQRVNMVLSLNMLAETKPHTAQSVLYKLYANTADDYEVRTAAVLLLMKTNPPTSMLQRMAEYTNEDSSKQVNSAVKSIIESLSELEESDNQALVNSAKAARPLLTKERYGLQYSKMYFKNLINPLTKSGLDLELNWIGSEDSNMPKGFYLASSRKNKGDSTPDIEIGGSVSSVRDLWRLIEKIVMKNNKGNDNNQNEQAKKHSPENIAKLLDIHGNDPQQLEGFTFMKNNYQNRFMSFDNHTLERLMKNMNELLEEMKEGRKVEETKLNNDEYVISYPTESGFPFRFTSRSPTLQSIEGDSKLENTNEERDPSALPDKTTVKANVRLVYSMKTQKRMSFVTPFEHQQYVAGIDRSVQVHLPLRAEIDVNAKDKSARIKIQPRENEQEFKLVQLKTEPYTSKQDIFDLEPVTKNKNTRVIQKNGARQSNFELSGKNNKKIAKFSWEKSSSSSKNNAENQNNNEREAIKELQRLGETLASMAYPLKPANAEYQKYSIKLSPGNDASVDMKVSYDSKEPNNQNNDNNNENESLNLNSLRLSSNLNGHERKQKLQEEASKNINNARTQAVDLKIEATGPLQSSLTVTLAHASSNVDPKARLLVQAMANSMNDKQYRMSAKAESKNPKIHSMDFEEILKANNRREIKAEIHYGKANNDKIDENNMSKVKFEAKMEQTENRKAEIRQTRNAEKCNRQKNQSGNKMTPECQKAREDAKSLDKVDVSITYENESQLKNLAMSALDVMQRMRNPLESYKDRQDKEDKDKIKIEAELSSDNQRADITVKSPEGKVHFNNVNLDPMNSEKSREDKNKENQAFSARQTNVCNLDKTQINTFNNRRYSVRLGECWHVAMTTVRKNDPDSPNSEQEIPKHMRATILTKENSNGQKELKVTLGKTEIKLEPSENPSESEKAKVKVNGEKVELSKHKNHQEKENDRVTVELHKMKDGSVKLVSQKYDIRIVYDGSRAEIEAGDRYRKSVRGLCGTHNGEPQNDQQTPKGCTLKKPEEFAATWALMTSDDKCEGPARENAEKAKRSNCAWPSTRAGNVISDREAGRKDSSNRQRNNKNDDDNCTKHRTKVMRSDNEICFSKRPVPSCSSKCKPESMKNKSIDYHCVPRNSAAEKIAQRVEDGANPDLSQKKTSKTEIQPLPTSCRA